MLGPGSVLQVGLPVGLDSCEPVHELVEVEQLLDLSAATAEQRVRLRLSGPTGPLDLLMGVDYRVTVIRYGALRKDPSVGFGELFDIDCMHPAGGWPERLGSSVWMLLNARGHGTSGSIQLVSRPLGERLLASFPSVYQA